jgi:hypothetical protein
LFRGRDRNVTTEYYLVSDTTSITVTVKLLVAVLWWASVTEQVTVVVPRAKTLDESGWQTGVNRPSTRSRAATW